MTPNQPYLFVEIWVPKRAPYTHDEYGWPTIVGDIVKPFVENGPNVEAWFLQEGPWWQLCFTAASLPDANKLLRQICRKKGFHIKRYIRGSNISEALAGSRWLPKKKQGTTDEERRSWLLSKACHAVSSLYLDSLVKRGRYWVPETPECTKQNPHGSLFESFMHLVANMSQARFDVQIKARTRWMHSGWQDTKVVCHL